MILVSTTFLVQNQYYSMQIQSAAAHDNARAATELIASEIRSVMEDGVRVAGKSTLTIRSPLLLAVVCNRPGPGLPMDAHLDGGAAAVDSSEVAGFAVRDTLTGGWAYYNVSWASLSGAAGTPAANCAGNGADTTWAQPEFVRLSNLETYHVGGVFEGDLVMLFRETTFSMRPSVLDPTSLGLFRQVYGQAPVEFATGIDSTAQFQYRTGTITYADTIVSGLLDDIDAVRIVANARRRSRSGIGEDITFGWATNVALRNVP
jgi:hypothetical protein